MIAAETWCRHHPSVGVWLQEETTLAEALKRGNPVVFFDITIADRASGRIKMELFKDVAPRVGARDRSLPCVVAAP